MLNRLLDVFASLKRHDVRYVTIGGIAAVIHGVPRATFDLDILIEASPENAQRLLTALEAAGLGTATLITAEELLAQNITIFKDRVRIDVQIATPGILFEDAWARRHTVEFKGQRVYVLCKDDLIASKRAAGRPVDLQDVEMLRQVEPG